MNKIKDLKQLCVISFFQIANKKKVMYYHEKLETLVFQWKNNKIYRRNENNISNEM